MTIENDTGRGNKKNQVFWILGCGTLFLVSLCVVLFIIFGGFATISNFMTGNSENLSIELKTPTSAVYVDESFNIQLLIANQGEKNVTIIGIRLPNEISEIASITNIETIDETISQEENPLTHTMNLTIAPNGEEIIVFLFEATNPGSIDSTIEIATENQTTSIEFELVILPDTGPETIQDAALTPSAITEVIPYKSVVQIIALIEMDGTITEGWTGSGTIISEDGLILTNAHVVLSDRYYQVADLIVAITEAQDQPPKQKFYADILQADANLDLAVIKVRSDLEGGPANFESLGITPVPLGDSQSLALGDELIIIGYPGIGGETITLTRGEVSGFTSQAQYGNRAYIKTSATFAGGNSGGLAATQGGEIIGIPTQLGSGDINVDIVDCRRLADTNRDGLIDEFDNCVPTGGFINALRPINLALPLIEAAKAGQIDIVENIPDAEHEDYSQTGDLILSDEFIDNTNNWSLGELPDAVVDINNGKLTINLAMENYLVYSTLPDLYDGVALGVDVSIIDPAYDGDFGFICGYQDEQNLVGLEISEDRFYTIWAYEGDEYITLVDWTYTDQIPEAGPYTLNAYCGSDSLVLAADGVLLVETTYSNYKPGLVGLVTGTFENPNLSVGFDNFLILKP